jgi:chromate transporter
MNQTENASAVISGTSSERIRTVQRSLAGLVGTMLKIGVIGFGGGTALIPVIEEEVVTAKKLVSRRDYEEQVVSACVTPGALPVEIAAGVGRKAFGIRGMILSAVMIAFPGAFLTVLIQSALSGESSPYLTAIRFLSIGVGAFICSLLISYAVKTVRSSAESRKQTAASAIIMSAVFLVTTGKKILSLVGLDHLASGFIQLSTFDVLLLSFAVILTVHVVKKAADRFRAGKKAENPAENKSASQVKAGDVRSLIGETGAWLLFLAAFAVPAALILRNGGLYIIRGIFSSLLSFGGGDAYLSVADALFVGNGMISTADFYGILVPAANVLPGSILCKILTGTGYLIGKSSGTASGLIGATAGFAISVAVSGMIFGIVYWMFRTFEDVPVFREISVWIRPIISGLLLGVTVTMVSSSLALSGTLVLSKWVIGLMTAGVAGLDLFLMLKKRTGSLLPMAISLLAGAALFLFR